MSAGGAASVRAVIAERAPAVLGRAPSEAVFWTGAGISAELPTGGPAGCALTDRALQPAFAGGTLAVLRRYYADLRIPRSRPRLETVLDVVRRVHGLPVLVDVLSDLRHPEPNGIHGFFAAHLAAGGRHVTANFDPCIELVPLAWCGEAEVVHFHGSFAEDPDGDGLGAALARIERGFPADIADRVTSALTAVPARCWYSLATADRISSMPIPICRRLPGTSG